MKKTTLLFVFLLLISLTSFGQIIANDDTVAIPLPGNAPAPQVLLADVLANDTLNGIPITLSNVTITQISSTTDNTLEGNANIAPDGSFNLLGNDSSSGFFYLDGIYNLRYRVCEIDNPGNCAEADVFVTFISPMTTAISSSYVDVNNDGFVTPGDKVIFSYTITNHSDVPAYTVYVDNTNNGGQAIPIINPGASVLAPFTTTVLLTNSMITSGQVFYSSLTNATMYGNQLRYTIYKTHPLNLSDGIQMKAFKDPNANGVQDTGEANFIWGDFLYVKNNDGVVHHIQSSEPVYLYSPGAGNTYNLSYAVDPTLQTYDIATPSSYSSVTVPNGSGVHSYSFRITETPYTDVSVSLLSLNAPRPGSVFYQWIKILNLGNQAVSGTLTFVVSNKATIDPYGYPPGATPTANGFTYAYSLPANGAANLYILMNVLGFPTVQLGDLITNTVSVTIPPSDINTLNNSASNTATVVSSYDPNDITEGHGPKIVYSTFGSNDYLTYVIRFENIGTADALDIRVENTLNIKLDQNTVKMIGSSYPCVLDRIGSNLIWRFDDINLPPSVPGNATLGHGYLAYQVKPKPGYAVGDIIPNSANIYFDTNPAVPTNVFTTEFVAALGKPTFAFDHLIYFPNPTQKSLFLSNTSIIDDIEITSLLGQHVMTKTINALQEELDLSGLASGIYFVKINSMGQSKTIKIIKE